jgi:Zn-dependent peptidase ImmA (M78 family)
VCDLYEDVHRPPEKQSIEVFCNRVAAATLLPREYLLSEAIVSAKPGFVNWTDTEILYLANRYGASREALLRRLLTVGRTTEAFYQARRKQCQDEYQAIKKEGGGGFAPQHTKAISSSGHLFVRLVLDNYRQDAITASDVSDFLDIRLKHLNKVEAAVLKPASSNPASF